MNDVKKVPTVDEVWEAIFACSHTITNNQIVLKTDGSGKNASNELNNRLKKLFKE